MVVLVVCLFKVEGLVEGGKGTVSDQTRGSDTKTEKLLQYLYFSTSNIGNLWLKKMSRMTGTQRST